ncbi:TonB-dependent receptor [Plebeiibacterium marinum]|uniref:TonB-dependent receptor n=1 Tax=Plebeiibacterium marinum TaxID=2992111 RepID=A0AAE3MEE6_9BACT|nr:TonB-dependent receptor [Plebeiobacterium marinum]MCW3806293.1 TonB-dependent receptor [Plebeiobacterium marinum]
MKRSVLIIAMVVFCSLYTMAQNGVLKGKLTDKNTGEPLVGATVMIKGTSIGTITNYDGDYELTDLESGLQTFVAAFIGYSGQEKEIEIEAGQTVTFDFLLYQDLIGLDEVMVTGVVNQKSALESSVAMTTIKPKFIEEFGAVTTAEMFKAIPGIRSESSGGEGNANIAVRGVPVASGGSKFLQLHEDGLPILQFGDISFGNADIFLRADQTVGRVEALKGGSASTFASNSPAGIINFISKTGDVAGGSIGTTLGVNYNSFRTDFEYGSPIGDDLKFHIGGFLRQGTGPRDPGYTGNYGGQIKANITKSFKNGYARLYFKYLNDKAISYMPMPVMVTGTTKNPTYKSIPGFDLKKGTLQSSEFLLLNSTDGQGNGRISNIKDGMHPVSSAVGGEFSFNIGENWQLKEKFRMAFTNGTFNSPFPAQVGTAGDIAESIAGSGYTLSYANGANAGISLSSSQISTLNGNGLLMRIHTFDVEMDNLNNFTNDVFITRRVDKMKATIGYYKAYQKIAMTWLWQTYLTDVSDDGPHLMDISSADGSFKSENGLLSHGTPYWGHITRGYDMTYNIDAPYANIEYEVSDNLNMDASIRYDFGNANGYYLDKNLAATDVNKDGTISSVEQEVPILDNTNPNMVDYNFDYMSYSFGVNYKLNKDQAVYARYSKGGRANADRLLYTSFLTEEGKTIEGLDADKIIQAELGYKYKSPKVGLIATGFYTKINEQNEEFGRAINKEFQTVGVELEVIAQLGKLNINSGATYTNAEILKSINSDEEGNTPRRVPALLYNISPSYPLMSNKLVLGCSLIGTSKVYAQDDNAIELPGYAYLNAFATYKIAKGFTLRANINNITNTLGFTEMEGDAFVDNSTNYLRARPITGTASTVTLTYKF